MVLSWSRAIYARFALDQTLESFLRGHVLAFTALGGVPRGPLYDNLKSVVLERAGDHIRFHPRILELAGHYHFAPRPCAPYRGNEKGKVERQIQYLRHAFFAARTFRDVDDLNAQLAAGAPRSRTCVARPGQRDRTVGRSPRRGAAAPAAAARASLRDRRLCAGRVRQDPYVRFDLNDYSIPHTLVRRPLTLVASDRPCASSTAPSSRAPRAQLRPRQGHRGPGAHRLAGREKRQASPRGPRPPAPARASHRRRLLERLALRGETLRRSHRPASSRSSTTTAPPSSPRAVAGRSRAAPSAPAPSPTSSTAAPAARPATGPAARAARPSRRPRSPTHPAPLGDLRRAQPTRRRRP